MSLSRITFKDLRTYCDWVERKDYSAICDYFNSFDGDDVFEKFKNILSYWECHVSDTIPISNNDKTLNVQLAYFIGEFPCKLSIDSVVASGDIKLHLNIPKKFTCDSDILPIYDLIHRIELFDTKMDLFILSNEDRINLINSLPSKVCNDMMNGVITNEQCVVTFANKSLSGMRINFLSNDPFFFLRGLFSCFSKDYFRDVIYNLSKKIDGDVLMDCDIKDIEYFSQKFNEESKNSTQKMDL